MKISEQLAELLEGRPEVDSDEQAFPFLTVDGRGFPHVALLSRAEVDARRDRRAILAVVASPGTRANLGRDGRAGLIAVGGTVAHYLKLEVVRTLRVGDLLGCVLRPVEHKADTIGIPLAPMGFRATGDVAALESWEASAAVLRSLSELP